MITNAFTPAIRCCEPAGFAGMNLKQLGKFDRLGMRKRLAEFCQQLGRIAERPAHCRTGTGRGCSGAELAASASSTTVAAMPRAHPPAHFPPTALTQRELNEELTDDSRS